LGVKIQYKTDIKEKFFAENKFDRIIIATGAKPVKLLAKGADMPHVVTAPDVLEGLVNVGGNVVVIGGGQVGAETANHLAVHLKNVTLVEMLPEIAPDEPLAPRWHLLRSLDNRKVRMMTNTSVTEIKEKSVILKKGIDVFEIPADTVVVAAGSKPDNTLAGKLAKKGHNVSVIGDAKETGLVLDATSQAFNTVIDF
jgi:pyruvate/2-oxoglutarate dehydrogenase complex dihydrolipoamide dehydrogenase (E3) component